MPTWLFFIGLTVLTMVLCVVVTFIYLGKDPNEEDELDKRLEELAAQNAKRRAERDAKNKAKSSAGSAN